MWMTWSGDGEAATTKFTKWIAMTVLRSVQSPTLEANRVRE